MSIDGTIDDVENDEKEQFFILFRVFFLSLFFIVPLAVYLVNIPLQAKIS